MSFRNIFKACLLSLMLGLLVSSPWKKVNASDLTITRVTSGSVNATITGAFPEDDPGSFVYIFTHFRNGQLITSRIANTSANGRNSVVFRNTEFQDMFANVGNPGHVVILSLETPNGAGDIFSGELTKVSDHLPGLIPLVTGDGNDDNGDNKPN